MTPRKATTLSASDRSQAVAGAVARWQRTLVDIGGRNNLLWFRDLPLGTLDLTTAHPGGLSRLLSGRGARLSDLVREPSAFEHALARARAIHDRSDHLKDTRGIPSCYLAIGMAQWQVPRAARPAVAPVLLRTCELRPTSPVADDFAIDLGRDAELNPVLVEYLRSEQDLEIDAGAYADMAAVTNGFDPYPVYAAIRRECAQVPGFEVAERLVIGNYTYAKLPLVADLAAHGSALGDHDAIAALAGDEAAADVLHRSIASQSDDRDPEREALVLDADASQARAVDAARSGADVIIEAAPGTGATQTVANLIATAVADDRTVLLVGANHSGLADVKERLAQVGLGHLVLDARDALADRRSTISQLVEAIDDGADLVDRHPGELAALIREHRDRLVAHKDAMHERREPWGVTLHETQLAMSALGANRPAPHSHVRLPYDTLKVLDRGMVVELGKQITEVAEAGAWTVPGAKGATQQGTRRDPWFRAHLPTQEDIDRAERIVRDLSDRGLAERRRVLGEILAESSVPAADSLAGMEKAFNTMTGVQRALEVFRPEAFDISLADYVTATAPRGRKTEPSAASAELGNDSMGAFARSRARRDAKKLLRPGKPPEDLHEELAHAEQQRRAWAELVGGGGRPEISARLDEGHEHIDALRTDLEWLGERLTRTHHGGDLIALDFDDLQRRLNDLAAHCDRLAVLPEVTERLDAIDEQGLGELLDDLAARGVPPKHVAAEVDQVWWASITAHAEETDERYGKHDGPSLHRDVQAFAAGDRELLGRNAANLRAKVARGIRDVLRERPEHDAMIRAELTRHRGLKSSKELFARIGDTLTTIVPCWAMSPLAVASLLPQGRWFDMVVVLDAGAVTTAETISAIARGSQVVLVGEPTLATPTNHSVIPDAPAPTWHEPQASLLADLAEVLPSVPLQWDHRSQAEDLVHLPNQHVYDGRLSTFPAATGAPAITLEHVDGTAEVRADTEVIESTLQEVDLVAELVLAHAEVHPGESLAVVTLSRLHGERILARVRERLSEAGGSADFFASTKPEPFVVIEASESLGVTRDVIVLALGFGKTTRGRVLHRFGDLDNEGGERLLATAMTRARSRMVVASALVADDLDPGRLKMPGQALLRELLVAAGGSDDPGARCSGDPSADPMRADLARRLRREGLTVHEDLGLGERIELAVEHPHRRGEMLLAIGSDGPRYAARRGTRERDRLRAERLERLGWRHVRVWTTDLYRDPARQIARIVNIVADETRPEGTKAHRRTSSAPTTVGTPTTASVPSTASSDASERDGDSETSGELAVPPSPPPNPPMGPDEPTDGKDKAKGKDRKRGRRRGKAEQTRDDQDLGWGEVPADERSHDRWLEEQRPPHWE